MSKAKSKIKRDHVIKFGSFQFNNLTVTIFELKIVVNQGNVVFGIDFLKLEIENRLINEQIVRSLVGFFFTSRMKSPEYSIQWMTVNCFYLEKNWNW